MLRAPSFSTARLSYRSTEPGDEAFFKRMWADEATLFGAMGNPCAPWSPRQREGHMKYIQGASLSVIIHLKKGHENDDEIPVGWMDLNEPAKGSQHRCAQFDMSLAKEHQGKGYGREALEWLLETAFLRFGFNRVEAQCFSWNEPALRLYKSLGFVVEGCRRKAMFQEGEWRDDIMFGMLQEEWRAAHQDKLQPVQKSG
ncbi:hypothetical protein JCM10213_009313 [Rhodosporidiobolus nylandii]